MMANAWPYRRMVPPSLYPMVRQDLEIYLGGAIILEHAKSPFFLYLFGLKLYGIHTFARRTNKPTNGLNTLDIVELEYQQTKELSR